MNIDKSNVGLPLTAFKLITEAISTVYRNTCVFHVFCPPAGLPFAEFTLDLNEI
jgi:hypothetical protein